MLSFKALVSDHMNQELYIYTSPPHMIIWETWVWPPSYHIVVEEEIRLVTHKN